jgi:hypothetical protein
MNKKLTEEEGKLCDEYALKMLQNSIKCNIEYDIEALKPELDIFWRKYCVDGEMPEIKIVDSPIQACKEMRASMINPKKSLAEYLGLVYFNNITTWWVAYYNFGVTVLNEKSGDNELDNDIINYERLSHKVHAMLAHKDVLYLIKYPISVSLKDNDLDKFQLHNPDGLAYEYADGNGLAIINGIVVPEYIVKESADNLDVMRVMAEVDVDVRREGLGKIGISRILSESKAKIIDARRGENEWDNYELLELDFGDKLRRFLKMWDVASKEWCYERVNDEASTVTEALSFQHGESVSEFIEPEKLT